MRKYGKVEPAFWPWANRKSLSDGGRLLALYLLTSPHSNSVGCYYLPDGYLMADLGWDAETITERFKELSRNRFAYRCETTSFVLIRDLLNHDPPANNNVGKNMASIIEEIPRDFQYWTEFKDILKRFANRFPNGFVDGLPNGMPNPEPNLTEPEPTNVPSQSEETPVDPYPKFDKLPTNGAGRIYPEAFEDFWAAFPRNGNDTKKLAYIAWRKVVPDVGADVLLDGAKRYAKELAAEKPPRPPEKCPHVQTWINREGWTAPGAERAPAGYKPLGVGG